MWRGKAKIEKEKSEWRSLPPRRKERKKESSVFGEKFPTECAKRVLCDTNSADLPQRFAAEAIPSRSSERGRLREGPARIVAQLSG